MSEAGTVAWAERQGWRDGAVCAPYRPPLTWGICADADDAYRAAYFHALAYGSGAAR